jgi:tetratricopeptide (TPR) repeat protein
LYSSACAASFASSRLSFSISRSRFLLIGEIFRWNEERRPEAIAAYEAAINLDPQALSAYDDLGGIFVQAGEEKRAEEVFRKGIAADPKRMAGRFALGRLLVKQGRLEEARELWNGRTSDEDRISPHFIALLTRAENLKKADDFFQIRNLLNQSD